MSGILLSLSQRTKVFLGLFGVFFLFYYILIQMSFGFASDFITF